MRAASSSDAPGPTKMGSVMAVVNAALPLAAQLIPVPAWLGFSQRLVARLVVHFLGRFFAGALEAIYQETIRQPKGNQET